MVDVAFSDGTKATKRPLPENIAQWIINESKDFTKKEIGKVSKSVRA